MESAPVNIEILIKKYLDNFVFEVFQSHLRDNDSINYYLNKHTEGPDSEELPINELFEKAIYDGLMNDQFTNDDIENEFGEDALDSTYCLWDCIDFDDFPFKKMLEKFIKKNKSHILGKLIRLTWLLWEKEKIVWINAWGDHPPSCQMLEFIQIYKSEIRGIGGWYTQNQLLVDGSSASILFNPCDSEEDLNEGYRLGKKELFSS